MRWRFGPFVLDARSRELTREGVPVPLSPKAFMLLEALIAGAPTALHRNDLYRVLWGETFVDEANLPILVHEIRQALHDDARSAQFVKTIHRHGYRFVADTTTEEVTTDRTSRYYVDIGGNEFPLDDGPNLVGRDRSAVVRLEESHVSRRHAMITVHDGSVTIEDLRSRNGTYVRGERTTGVIRLTEGDVVQVGSIIFVLRERATDSRDTDAFPQLGGMALI